MTRTPQASDLASEREALLALTLVPGVGPGRIRALVAALGSAQAVREASPHTLAQVDGIGRQTALAIAHFDAAGAVAAQLDRAARVGAYLVTWWDDAFPPLLRETFDPPVVLWVRGDLVAEAPAVALVGTRRATEYGRQTAHALAAALAARGVTVVSGLAYGIDAAAHRGALEGGGRTVAVLGSGADRIYPGRHAELARAITEQGAVVSEFPLGAAPDAVNFPRRNRIVSGMSLGTIVVEAFEAGGALITARLALEQNREVFAVPHPLNSPAGAGCNRLIQQLGAKLILDVDDVLEELGLQAPAEPGGGAPPDLNPVEQALYDALDATPVHIDALCLRTGLDPSTALVYLLSLEFKGVVAQMAGKQFYRC